MVSRPFARALPEVQREGIQVSAQREAMQLAIQRAGPKGIARDAMADLLKTSPRNIVMQTMRLRQQGATVLTAWRPDGGVYFAQQEWLDAAELEWRKHVSLNLKRHEAKRAALDKTRRAAARAVRVARKPAEPEPKPPKPEPKPPKARKARKALKAPDLLNPEAKTMIRRASVKNFGFGEKQPVPLMPAKTQYMAVITGSTKVTRAAPFVDQRWAPDLVRRVVDPEQCSAWARAATERRA